MGSKGKGLRVLLGMECSSEVSLKGSQGSRDREAMAVLFVNRVRGQRVQSGSPAGTIPR